MLGLANKKVREISMIEKVLVPVDIAHLDKAKSIIEVAMQNVSDTGKVYLLYVVEDIPKWAEVQLPKDQIKKSIQQAKSILEEMAKKCHCPVEMEVLRGRTYKTILEFAKKQKIDLIVLASQCAALQKYYLGSNAAKVVRHANCSVYLLR